MSMSTEEELRLMDDELMCLLSYVSAYTICESVLNNTLRVNAAKHLAMRLEKEFGAYQAAVDFCWVYYHHGKAKAEQFLKDLTWEGTLYCFGDEQERDDWLNGTGDWAEMSA